MMLSRRSSLRENGTPSSTLRRQTSIHCSAHWISVASAAATRPMAGGNGRAAKIPLPEQLGLGLFPEPGAHLQCVPRGQAQQPAARRAAPRDLDDDAAERRQVELVAAEAPWYEHAVEAGVEELL